MGDLKVGFSIILNNDQPNREQSPKIDAQPGGMWEQNAF